MPFVVTTRRDEHEQVTNVRWCFKPTRRASSLDGYL